jgi:hypothetical protein
MGNVVELDAHRRLEGQGDHVGAAAGARVAQVNLAGALLGVFDQILEVVVGRVGGSQEPDWGHDYVDHRLEAVGVVGGVLHMGNRERRGSPGDQIVAVVFLGHRLDVAGNGCPARLVGHEYGHAQVLLDHRLEYADHDVGGAAGGPGYHDLQFPFGKFPFNLRAGCGRCEEKQQGHGGKHSSCLHESLLKMIRRKRKIPLPEFLDFMLRIGRFGPAEHVSSLRFYSSMIAGRLKL